MKKIIIVVGATASVLLFAGCGSTVAKDSSGASLPATSVNAIPSEPSAVPSDTPTPTEDLTGPIGTTYTDTSTDGTEYSVTLTKVTDPGKPTDPEFNTPDPGKRYIAVRFVIKGLAGTASDDVYTQTVAIGSDDQTYEGDYTDVDGCTSFNSGEFKVTPGHQAIGCIMFQVPKGVKVASVQWGSSMSSSQPATWTVS